MHFGVVTTKLRDLGRSGSSARLDGYDVTVSEVTGRRIKRLIFTKHPAERNGAMPPMTNGVDNQAAEDTPAEV